MAVMGCQTSQVPQEAWERSEDIHLREGDAVKITFPGAPNLDTTQQIRRDGKISLAMLGEVTAAGLTPAELERMLLELYSTQLVSKEVVVSVVSSSFSVFVTGAVLRPGKITSDRPISVLEAIMEAGGPVYSKANLKSVAVIREEEGGVQHYRLNVKVMLEGNQSRPFYLKPSDIIYVPERFSWF
jgi:polysaccharide export outer membrane protein